MIIAPLVREARPLAIYLCHNDSIPEKEIAAHFDVSKKTVNRVISTFQQRYPVWSLAVQQYSNVVISHKERERAQREQFVKRISQQEPLLLSSNSFLERAQNTGEIGRYTAKIARLKEKLRKAKLHIAKLETVNAEYKQRLFAEQLEGELESSPNEEEEDEEDCILKQMTHLASVNPFARRYSQQLFRMSYCLMTLSPCAYSFARKILPLPSRSQVYDRFSTCISETKQSLTGLDYTHRLLEAFIEARPSESGRIVCTLGVDAFAIRLFLRTTASLARLRKELTLDQLHRLDPLLEDKSLLARLEEEEFDEEETQEEAMEEEEEEEEDACEEFSGEHLDDVDKANPIHLFQSYNSCFIYVLIPVDNNLPSMTIHLQPAENGSANSRTRKTVKKLITTCALYNIEIPYVCADGDPWWNRWFKKVFLVMQRTRFFNLADFSLQVYEECRKQDIPVVVTDLLHYVKAFIMLKQLEAGI